MKKISVNKYNNFFYSFLSFFRKKKNKKLGFSLLEILLAVFLIVILSTIVILALNPKKHFADSRNAKRKSNLNSLINSVYQYSIDNNGEFPSGIDENLKMIGTDLTGCEVSCGNDFESAQNIEVADQNQVDFSQGVFSNIQWDNGSNSLILSSSGRTAGFGTYVSRVFDATNESSAWNKFSYSPGKPYGKELPTNNGVESAYLSGNANMLGNVLLFKMNESSGNIIYDYSGLNNNGNLIDPSKYQLNQAGILNGAIKFNNNSSYEDGKIVVPHSASLNLANNSSICVWVNLSDYSQSNAGFVHKGSESDFSKSEYSLQVLNNGRRPIFDVVDSSGNDRYVQSSISLNSNTWYHVCGTFDYNDAVKIYVNGVQRGSLNWDPSWIPRQSDGSLQVGAQLLNGNRFGMKGLLDEVSIFNRTLSASEIVDFYHRGALKIKYQLRSCADQSCSADSFSGPDGNISSYYSEINNNTNFLPAFDILNLNNNRYFQYRAILETIDSSISPELKKVFINYFSSGALELTSDSCLDLSSSLVPEYLVSIPFDPKLGDLEKTYYGIKKINNRIKIISCSPENNQTIEISR